MVVNYVELKGFEAFSEYTTNVDIKGPPVYFYFSGSKYENGASWCPDCVEVMVRHNRHYKIDIHNLGDYGEFTSFVDNLPVRGPNVYFLFTGKKKENGRTEPVVKAYLTELEKDIVFAYVDVGDRDYWKDTACPFRTDNRTKLMVIPTMIKWKGVQRLEGSQCNKRDLLQMLFEDDE